jgi:hypothetical protein
MNEEQTVMIENEQESYMEDNQSEDKFSNKENSMFVERDIEP